MAPQTWLITGCSSGFGLEIAREALLRGDNVIATSRNPSKTPTLVSEINSHPQGHWLQLDVSSPLAELQAIITSANKIFPQGISILVNNAGYSVLGAVEDIPEATAKAQFEVNYWGAMRMIKAVLPTMRSQGHGVIVNVSSIGGLDCLATSGVYGASKFALEGMSESLALEVAPFGVRVLLVEPGAFRTSFLTPTAMTAVPASAPYQGGVVDQVIGKFASMDGKQVGDTKKGAQRIVDIVNGEGVGAGKTALLRLPLGSDCYARAMKKVKGLESNLEEMKSIALSTDFDA